MPVVVNLKLRANERPLALQAPSPGVAVSVRPVFADSLYEQGLGTEAGLLLDVRDRLVIGCQSERSGDGLASRIGNPHLEGTRLTGPVHRLRGREVQVE